MAVTCSCLSLKGQTPTEIAIVCTQVIERFSGGIVVTVDGAGFRFESFVKVAREGCYAGMKSIVKPVEMSPGNRFCCIVFLFHLFGGAVVACLEDCSDGVGVVIKGRVDFPAGDEG